MSSSDIPVVCHCGADVSYDDDEPSIYCSVACARLDSLNKLNAKSPGARRSASSSVSSSLSFSTSSAASSMSSQAVDTPRHSSEAEDLPTFLTAGGESDTLDEGFEFEMVTHAHSQRSPTLPEPVSHYEACYAREVALKGASGASGLFSNASLSSSSAPPAPAPVASTSASPARPTLRRVRKPVQKSAFCSSSDDESDFDYEDRSRTPRSWGRSDAVSTPLTPSPATSATCTQLDIFQITQSIVTRDPEASGAYAYAFPPGLGLDAEEDSEVDGLSTTSGFTTDAEEFEFDDAEVIQLLPSEATSTSAAEQLDTESEFTLSELLVDPSTVRPLPAPPAPSPEPEAESSGSERGPTPPPKPQNSISAIADDAEPSLLPLPSSTSSLGPPSPSRSPKRVPTPIDTSIANFASSSRSTTRDVSACTSPVASASTRVSVAMATSASMSPSASSSPSTGTTSGGSGWFRTRLISLTKQAAGASSKSTRSVGKLLSKSASSANLVSLASTSASTSGTTSGSHSHAYSLAHSTSSSSASLFSQFTARAAASVSIGKSSRSGRGLSDKFALYEQEHEHEHEYQQEDASELRTPPMTATSSSSTSTSSSSNSNSRLPHTLAYLFVPPLSPLTPSFLTTSTPSSPTSPSSKSKSRSAAPATFPLSKTPTRDMLTKSYTIKPLPRVRFNATSNTHTTANSGHTTGEYEVEIMDDSDAEDFADPFRYDSPLSIRSGHSHSRSGSRSTSTTTTASSTPTKMKALPPRPTHPTPSSARVDYGFANRDRASSRTPTPTPKSTMLLSRPSTPSEWIGRLATPQLEAGEVAARLSLDGSVAGSGVAVDEHTEGEVDEDEVSVSTETSDMELGHEHDHEDEEEEEEDEQRAMHMLAAMHGQLCAAAVLQ